MVLVVVVVVAGCQVDRIIVSNRNVARVVLRKGHEGGAAGVARVGALDGVPPGWKGEQQQHTTTETGGRQGAGGRGLADDGHA